ncbi:DUF397 domain-containing protein [Streptomyces sp. NPDC014733]|uniref:DUF397 domain-containing protein n=1 Tax=Streptomyces sp. NPDC014733 TaxID=3364885 RepID=UPI0036F6E7D3
MIPPNSSWVKSSYSSQDGGDCLEWSPASAIATSIVPIRDSKAPDGPVLSFPAGSFAQFVAGVKAGQFGA